MPYVLSTAMQSPNFYTPGQCQAHYGIARQQAGITIHWWGDPNTNPTFDSTVAYLCRPRGNTSAHYVVEAGRVARIVDPKNAAWHAGSAQGNATTIGIECNPRQSDDDYRTIAELVRDLRAQYGDMPLYPHRHWFATYCPGTYDLARIDALARALTPVTNATPTGGSAPVAPAPLDIANPALAQEDDMPTIYDAPGRGLWLADGAGPLVGLSTTGEADALTAKGVARLPVTAAVLDQMRANRLGMEVLFSPNGFAVGRPGERYIPLGKQAEVDHWKSLGAVQRSVDAETFANLTA